jgi:uncharacterized membrane protein (DUF4010 family)
MWHFVVTIAFSFVIGLEFHSYRRAAGRDLGFGTTRTFTLIGLLGFTLYLIDESGRLYLLGMLLLAAFLLVYYARRLTKPRFSLLSPILALLTFLVGPIVLRLPEWFLVLFTVTVLIMLGEKPWIRRLSDAMREEETVVLPRFLVMAGVILPLLPDSQIAPPLITVTYYQAWLAMVVVSGLSYLSYLAQTYFFKQRGMLLTGVLGGLYSSTAATVVIARRAAETSDTRLVAPAIILATAMMYLRLLLLIFVLGHHTAALHLAAPFLLFVLASCAVAYLLYRKGCCATAGNIATEPLSHPLEVSTAATFAVLFVIFAAVTQYIDSHFGSVGVHTLSFFIGLTDIDPFILSLLAGKMTLTPALIIGSIVIAAGSNNLFKAGYALVLARRHGVAGAALWLAGLFAASFVYVFWIL